MRRSQTLQRRQPHLVWGADPPTRGARASDPDSFRVHRLGYGPLYPLDSARGGAYGDTHIPVPQQFLDRFD